ncbi:MAG: DUF4339 domain-containing protein [Candidatus Hydrogenedentota bacterium]
MRYWIYIDNEVQGPCNVSELQNMGITQQTQVCPEGSDSWVFVSDIPELNTLTNYDQQYAETSDSALASVSHRKKIFIIHGRGIRLIGALRFVISLLETKIYYNEGNYYTHSQNLRLIRYLIYEPSEMHKNKLLSSLDKLYISKLLIAPFYQYDIGNESDLTQLSQFKINEKLNFISTEKPDLSGNELAETVYKESLSILSSLFGMDAPDHHTIAHNLKKIIGDLEKDRKLLESEAKKLIKDYIDKQSGSGEEVVAGLIEIQRIFEQGGDLDTIGSNSLYGAWFLHNFMKEFKKEPVYGLDYQFDFVNYQESFMHLTRHQNCDIYIPDFPFDAIPDLEESARALLKVGSIYKRFDDHHPWTNEILNTLVRLKEENVIEHFALSGPKKGESQTKEEQKCGTDMIYESLIKDTEINNSGIEELTRLAHVQDLHIIEDRNAIDISKLIGSRHSKIEMVQRLMHIKSKDEIDNILNTTGWRLEVIKYERELQQYCKKILKNLVLIEFRTPVKDGNYLDRLSGIRKFLSRLVNKISFNTIDISKFLYRSDRTNTHKIYISLSPYQSGKESRINIASAINYLKEKLDMDYFFYTYGSSLMTTRKVNEMDTALDLGVLMSVIGSSEDGGHPSAATCKPSKNPNFPKEKFQRLKSDNFLDYCGYIATRIRAHTSLELVRIKKIELPAD